ncbi:MAG: serine hydrolase family protein [Candidatus Levybacteria bacterium]|nr:serine hydrolase family protein [Candidatus Levybacteria bacterium]
MKRVFIIHGWDGYPEEGWFPWLKSQLEKEYDVIIPSMPDTENPKIVPWVRKLEKTVGEIRKDDILIGHSIGCQAILRFLEKTDNHLKVDKVILVAPWLRLTNLEDEESWKIAKPWLEAPINLSKVKIKAKSFTTVFSDNDPFVPLNNKNDFKTKLGAKIVIERNKGHFNGDDGVTELPVIMKLV